MANAVVAPKMGIFEGWGAPSQVSLTVAQIRTAPRPTSKQKDLQFATVESNVSTTNYMSSLHNSKLIAHARAEGLSELVTNFIHGGAISPIISRFSS